jgi:hypothetical protein
MSKCPVAGPFRHDTPRFGEFQSEFTPFHGDRTLPTQAKKSLGIRSVRNGFGDAGEWLWQLERQPASPVSKPLAQPPPSIEDAYAEALEEVPPDVRARRIPSSWIDGVERLQYHRPMTGVPQHRWRQFIDDCNNFLSSKQAERAAELGWNARHLFGSRRDIDRELQAELAHKRVHSLPDY